MIEPCHHLVIGIGNEYRRDDAVGLIVARRLREKVPGDITILEQTGEGAALMEAWQGAEAVILVDAVHSGAAPGTIFRIAAHQQSIPANFFHYSTHAFSVAEAVELARAMRQLPPRLVLFGIEGKSFAAGVGLSSEVEKAADEAVGSVVNEMANFFTI
jgi:hydrogenase maturation protease